MSDKPLRRCPKCRGKVRRLLGTGAGLIFKGSGFYCTDYRSASYKKEAGKDKGGKDTVKTGSEAPAKTDAGKKKD